MLGEVANCSKNARQCWHISYSVCSNVVKMLAKGLNFSKTKSGRCNVMLVKIRLKILTKRVPCDFLEFRAVQKCVHLVDVDKCCKMSIQLQKSVLIQTRTSYLFCSILVASRDLIFTDHPHPTTSIIADSLASDKISKMP